jgi:hypothetical protein
LGIAERRGAGVTRPHNAQPVDLVPLIGVSPGKRPSVGAGNREWNGPAPDFQVLASLARYHAHKQRAALNLEWFDLTGNANALAAAKSSQTAGLDEWERLVKFTDGLYSSNFANGPDDVGDWKDKLPYVRHDLELIREREEILQRFGRFDFAYDFGSPPSPPSTLPPFLTTPYIRTNNVEPRFTAVSTDTVFDERTGYGWVPGSWRRSTDVAGLALAPYQEIRATARVPYNPPHDVLFRDYIRTDGAHDFVVKAPPARYEVTFLHPDRTAETQVIDSAGDRLRVHFPNGDWAVSGLVIRGPQSTSSAPAVHSAGSLPGLTSYTNPQRPRSPANRWSWCCTFAARIPLRSVCTTAPSTSRKAFTPSKAARPSRYPQIRSPHASTSFTTSRC